ncbi:MAG: GNAT superfamily N-acetyltransferase [Ascidiaceihabitans sp.]|jgi:GNAT superfamily N-acetyltransferase|tara:strand:+ start:1565 stop:2164 length:600 start_codon:yes stop_codon:yes gene_type:complete
MLSDGYHDVPKGKLAMVITQLEMRTRADTRPVLTPDGVTLRRMENITLDQYRDIYRRVGEEWLWFSRLTMQDADLSAIIHDPKVQLFTLVRDGQTQALLELDFRTDNECELAFFGLTKDLIGTGSGRYLMNFAINTVWDHPVERFHLHTCTIDSPMALNFYARSGFTAVGRKIEVANDPRNTSGWDKTIAPQIPIIKLS